MYIYWCCNGYGDVKILRFFVLLFSFSSRSSARRKYQRERAKRAERESSTTWVIESGEAKKRNWFLVFFSLSHNTQWAIDVTRSLASTLRAFTGFQVALTFTFLVCLVLSSCINFSGQKSFYFDISLSFSEFLGLGLIKIIEKVNFHGEELEMWRVRAAQSQNEITAKWNCKQRSEKRWLQPHWVKLYDSLQVKSETSWKFRSSTTT
jgi:hypothetical protein